MANCQIFVFLGLVLYSVDISVNIGSILTFDAVLESGRGPLYNDITGLPRSWCSGCFICINRLTKISVISPCWAARNTLYCILTWHLSIARNFIKTKPI